MLANASSKLMLACLLNTDATTEELLDGRVLFYEACFVSRKVGEQYFQELLIVDYI
jgi:hypothetical protein